MDNIAETYVLTEFFTYVDPGLFNVSRSTIAPGRVSGGFILNAMGRPTFERALALGVLIPVE